MADVAAPTHELISDGWFGEKEVMWPGQQMRLKVENVLFAEKSKFQDVLVFDSSTYGRVLVLDGVIQLTERDEFAYQEMLTHIPMFAHASCPKNVLIVGGGDGGMLREVMKHPGVEHVTMCDIDAMVPEVSKKHLPSMSVAFSDPRLELVCEDAAVFVAADSRKYVRSLFSSVFSFFYLLTHSVSTCCKQPGTTSSSSTRRTPWALPLRSTSPRSTRACATC